MKKKVVITNGKGFQKETEIADTFIRRFFGLMGRKSLGAEEALLLLPCKDVHCCFMRFPIDVVYLDKEYQVLKKETMAPWSFGKIVKNCKAVLEVNEGQAEQLEIGEKLQII